MPQSKIVGELGEAALLLPALVNEGLAANDRTGPAHGDRPRGARDGAGDRATGYQAGGDRDTGESRGAVGEAVFDPRRAAALAATGRPVLLIRSDISTDDIGGLAAATGGLTGRGGRTSHAAVVARRLNKVCVVGCRERQLAPDGRSCHIDGALTAEGDTFSPDGNSGRIYLGALEVTREAPTAELAEVERWNGARTGSFDPAA